MPKSKQKTNRVSASGNDSGDEECIQPSQASLTQSQKVLSSFSKEEVERRVSDLVRYLLIMDQKKMPIRRQDISKNVLKEQSRAFPLLMKKAEEKLKIFGINLVEVEGKQQKSYMLVNSIYQDANNPHIVWSPEDNSRMGLIMIILSLILMNGNVISDSLLWHTLQRFGIDQDVQHEVFGDVKKLITQEFVRQGYIEFIRQPNTDPPQHELKWGPRAKAETTKRNVLEFVCQIYGDITPQQWTSHWQDIVRTEGGNDTDADADQTVEIS